MSQKIEIIDYKIKTPVEITIKIDGVEQKIIAHMDYANRELSVPEEYKGLNLEALYFEYLHEVNSLPTDFFAIDRPPAPNPEEF